MVSNMGFPENDTKGGATLAKAATSLRPHIVQVMAANPGRILATEEIYERVAALGVASFDPRAKRDRNLVNRELSDLAARLRIGDDGLKGDGSGLPWGWIRPGRQWVIPGLWSGCHSGKASAGCGWCRSGTTPR